MSVKRQTLLWKISTRDAQDGYLFGTMHVRDDSAFAFFDAVQPYIAECTAYAGEMNLDEAAELGLSDDMLLPDQQTILDLLSKRKFQRLRNSLWRSFRFDISRYIRLQPMFVTNLIAESLLSNDHSVALDQAIWNNAKESGKQMKGVESYADQMRTLSFLSVQSQMQQLIELSRNPAKLRRNMQKMTTAYTAMQIHELYRFSTRGLGRMRKPLIYQRNRKMADSIQKLIVDSSCFIAVGAGHLSGEHGLLRILKKKGLTLTPIQLSKSNLDSRL